MQGKKKAWVVIGSLIMVVMLALGGLWAYNYYLNHTLTQTTKAAPIENPVNFGNHKVSNEDKAQVVKDRNYAYQRNWQNQLTGRVIVPKVNINLPIYRGTSRYSLAMGAGTFYYSDAKMGQGNYVLAGHNMLAPGVLFSSLGAYYDNGQRMMQNGDVIKLVAKDKVYIYKVYKTGVVSPYQTFVNGKATQDNILALPAKGEAAKVTLFTCTQSGTKRFVVMGHLAQVKNR